MSFKELFFDVHSSFQRLEIIQIFTYKFIRETLKEELNFLYIRNLSDLRFSLIINILFKEFANEWISFAQEELSYSREDSLNEIQNKKRVQFILSIVQDYFQNYKKYFFIEIIDTFFELIEGIPITSKKNYVVESVLNSGLMLRGNIPVMKSYSQLLAHVKAAKDVKNSNLSKLQIEISEISTNIEFGELELKDRQKQEFSLIQNREAVVKLQEMPLYNFNGALDRVKETMLDSMIHKKVS
jgi:hypothetical protein